jgi:peptide chain release factor 2
VVQCQNERSQLQNKTKAMQMLKAKLYILKQEEQMNKESGIRGEQKDINFGSQIRSYVFDDRRVKDHRTNYQTSDVDGVMDGKIDDFIKAYLMEFPTNDDES